ncbi:MAG TPA: hypothetical protein VI451_02800 [Anaerolineales bacterium]|nr:hypothetical protein [Anaerolineales bacterium]
MLIIGTAKIANTTVGHIDHAMAYLSGFQRLGHEVYLMEHVGSNRCTDSHNQKVPFEKWDGRIHFEGVARAYGIWPRCCLIYKDGQATYGMPFSEAVKVAKRCDLLITRSGQINKASEIFNSARCRAYFDGNPGNTQVLHQQRGGEYEALDQYDHLFTLGLNIGAASCGVPTGKSQWRPLVRPVFLPMWPMGSDPNSKRFTTISTWKGRATFELQGKCSGEKSDNWLKFVELPKRTAQELEIALRVNSADQQADRDLFRQNGWLLTDPERLRHFDDYKDYIGESRAEFSVAHNRYVEFSTGWFSDRSALYLASGKPVLVQSTGIENHLPTGKGLLTFTTMEEAVAGIEEINRDYSAHCKAAREIAEEYFDSDKVLTKILNHMGYC